MDALGIIIFIIFMIFRAMSAAQKNQKGRGGAPPQPHFPEQDFPQQTTTKQQRPWWEEWDDADEEEYFPPVKQTKPEPVKIKEEPVRKKQFIDSMTPAVKTTKERSREEKRKEQNFEQPETLVPNLDADQVRQGIIWAEILQPPKAKRNKYKF